MMFDCAATFCLVFNVRLENSNRTFLIVGTQIHLELQTGGFRHCLATWHRSLTLHAGQGNYGFHVGNNVSVLDTCQSAFIPMYSFCSYPPFMALNGL